MNAMDGIAILAFIFALVSLPLAIPAFMRVLSINKELEELKAEVEALKEQMRAAS